MVKYKYIISALVLATGMASCDKVDPEGVIIASTKVDDRVKQSYYFWEKDLEKKKFAVESATTEYSFLVISDSHTTTNTDRLQKTFDMTVDPNSNNILCAHLGDFVETQPEYYALAKELVDGYDEKYENFAFFPVVGNHDVTRNGWALFTQIFGSSTYAVTSIFPDPNKPNNYLCDLFIFLDSANGTMGKRQLEEILPKYFDLRKEPGIRHCFVFTHGNFFRPSQIAFSSNYPREELYYLLNIFSKNKVNAVFAGHIHAEDDRMYGGVRHLTLGALSERNSPEKGQVIKVVCKADGTIDYQKLYIK